MHDKNFTIEDLLELITGLQGKEKIEINPADTTIMYSIARQVFKGTSLTDRQYNLMQEKLQNYKNQFIEKNINFDHAVKTLRNPLRHIDRSKYIKTVIMNKPLHGIDNTQEWLEVRFPFAKKLIMVINDIPYKTDDTYHHEKGSHVHYFLKTEQILLRVISGFLEKNFEIDKTLIEEYLELKKIKDNPLDHLPCIFENNIFNVDDNIVNEFKEYSSLQLIDRHRRYGLVNLDKLEANSLITQLAYRDDTSYLSNPTVESIDSIIECIYTLDRFPLLVILDEQTAESQIYEIYNSIKNIVLNVEQSVLFRQEGQTEFNSFVKEKNLNNWVDNTTKVVYINNNKLPKIMIKNEWKPITTLMFGSKTNRYIDSYVQSTCDLIIYRDTMISPLRRYSQYYGNL